MGHKISAPGTLLAHGPQVAHTCLRRSLFSQQQSYPKGSLQSIEWHTVVYSHIPDSHGNQWRCPSGKGNCIQNKIGVIHKVSRYHKLPSKPSIWRRQEEWYDVCYQHGKKDHLARDCRFKNAVCNFCKCKGHLQLVCKKKKQQKLEVKYVVINSIFDKAAAKVPKLEVPIQTIHKTRTLELDTTATVSFLSASMWEQLERPKLWQPNFTYQSGSSHSMPVQDFPRSLEKLLKCLIMKFNFEHCIALHK